MKIHGAAYIIIGAIVIGFSLYTNSRTENQSMTLFIYIGLIFVIIGIFKLVSGLLHGKNHAKKDYSHQIKHHPENNQKGQYNHAMRNHTQHYENPHQYNNYNQYPGQQTHHPQQQQQRQSSNPTHPTHHNTNIHHSQNHNYPQHSQHHSMFSQTITCQKCGARNNLNSNFCGRCGNKLR